MRTSLISFVSLGLLAALVGWLELPRLVRSGMTRDLWAFVIAGVIAFTLLGMAAASLSLSSLNEALVRFVQPLMDPWIMPPPH